MFLYGCPTAARLCWKKFLVHFLSIHSPYFTFPTYFMLAQMIIYLSFILWSFSTTIAFPLQPVDSALLPDFTNFQLDLVPNVETADNSNNEPGLVEQTQPPLPGISTSQNTGPPIIDSSLDTIQFQPSSPSSNFNMAGSRFELARNLPQAKKGAPAAVTTVETVYLCCESQEEDKYLCDDRER